MLKNITLSAEELLLIKAREKAQKEHKSLNQLFREWLKKYINNANIENEFDAFMQKVSYVDAGKKFTRDDMNAR
jgi:hypothetical protein